MYCTIAAAADRESRCRRFYNILTGNLDKCPGILGLGDTAYRLNHDIVGAPLGYSASAVAVDQVVGGGRDFPVFDY